MEEEVEGEETEETEEGERKDTPKEGKPVAGLWRGQQRDWTILCPCLCDRALPLSCFSWVNVAAVSASKKVASVAAAIARKFLKPLTML